MTAIASSYHTPRNAAMPASAACWRIAVGCRTGFAEILGSIPRRG